ncbi:CoA-binding protein [Marinisporobacter balticus]|uniref:Putative CoA-binding protein n=1 Tax=Marinisporobacter balticus TaxID=2018667 RepID=A0A4R2KM82_9FIRM|nr:CoA-binding protein [Marinisporobacter balticus]TCO74534.1 putative CoA-binding protein [Marinisporobacter balticus]
MNGQEMLTYKNWAVAGDVLNPSKYAYKIKNRLTDAGYKVLLVNPRGKSEEVFSDLKEIKEKVDVIDLCINPHVGIKIMKEAYTLGINKVLIQPGAESEEILSFCKEKDIAYITSCVLVELAQKGM